MKIGMVTKSFNCWMHDGAKRLCDLGLILVPDVNEFNGQLAESAVSQPMLYVPRLAARRAVPRKFRTVSVSLTKAYINYTFRFKVITRRSKLSKDY